jgi:hypothetical protein
MAGDNTHGFAAVQTEIEKNLRISLDLYLRLRQVGPGLVFYGTFAGILSEAPRMLYRP